MGKAQKDGNLHQISMNEERNPPLAVAVGRQPEDGARRELPKAGEEKEQKEKDEGR